MSRHSGFVDEKIVRGISYEEGGGGYRVRVLNLSAKEQ